MKWVGYVGRRSDTHEIVQALLIEKGTTPAVGLSHVRGTYLFELDLGEQTGSKDLWSQESLRRALARALITLVAIGLTPQQKDELKKQVPNLTVLEDFNLLPE